MNAAWQPIETADVAQSQQDDVLLWMPTLFGNGRVRQGFWRKSLGRWGFYGSLGMSQEKRNQPTHWMPLPSPPEETAR